MQSMLLDMSRKTRKTQVHVTWYVQKNTEQQKRWKTAKGKHTNDQCNTCPFLLKTVKAVTRQSGYYGTDGKLGARTQRTCTKTNKKQTGRLVLSKSIISLRKAMTRKS